MREIRTSGLMSGEGKRSFGQWLAPPRPSSTLQIKGKKRHILVDTQGLLMHAIVHAADIQDRDGGAPLMATLFGALSLPSKLFADGGYQGPQFQAALGAFSSA